MRLIGYPNGVTETTTYDKAGISSAIADATSTATLASSTLTRDANDALTGVTTSGPSAGPGLTFGHNQLGQITTFKVGTASATSYGYDSGDNLATLPNGITQTFDAAHELKKTAAATVTYDTRGNLTAQVPTSGSAAYASYDQANRMANFSLTSGFYATYLYNGDGLRTAKTVNGTTTNYTWDITASIPLLLSDGSTSYLYGPGGIPIEQISTSGTTTYLHHDQQGSTVLLTNSSGPAVGTYAYTPYGVIFGHTGTATTSLRYDGQYQDDESGLYYLRARYYNPNTGQFITRDPIEAQTAQPYAYANNDPVDQIDPLGLCGHWYDVKCQVTSAANSVGQFMGDHKVATGIGLGALSVATGGAAFLIDGALLTTTLSGAAVVTGAGAAVLDSTDCARGSTAACVGAGLGFAGALAGGGPLVASVGGIAETSGTGAILYGLFGGLSLNFGAAGLVFDTTMAIANEFCGSESN